ncbi:YEATS domain-containing protein 2-like [Saccostrea echinata]|uniref:YEATS domain-containing protein 2-like n=1 Tax=Saccostrea echinata TaxID=191078 RepID=UPI002A8259BB|nr:YEATS domain-containing protein 2-like [Saccostrea echinata]
MATKRGHIDIDPDYEDVTQAQTKRQKVLEEDAKETTRKKIDLIVRKEFHQEIKNKEKELDCIDQSLRHSQMMMDRLRACIIANYYGAAGQQRYIKGDPQQTAPIHPTVKDTLGKRPLNVKVKMEPKIEGDSAERLIMKQEPQDVKEEDKMIKEEPSVGGITNRSDRFKVKKRIVIGNVSKYIPVDRRDENDQSTHKWMVYVRGPKGEPNIDHFVKKVWFFLHPSYRPNDLVEVSQPPFHLTRRGWGEFPVRVQLYFKDSRNKKVDVIHQLKLDRTYTGLQTLGSETVIDVELEKEIDIKSSNRVTCNGSSSTLVGKESNVTVKEHISPVKKEFKQEPISPTSTESKTPNKNLSKSKNISPFSPSSKQTNMTLTLGTLGSLTSHSMNKSGTVEGGQGRGPINGLKQQSVHSSTSDTDGPGSKNSSELQKMLLQSTPPSVTKTSVSTGNVQLTHIVQVPKGAQISNTSNVKSANAGKANSQSVKSLQNSSTGVSSPGIRPPLANQISVPSSQATLSSATPGTTSPAQTLYIRCKDNQGNIFLVPHHLLKSVPGTPGQPVNNQTAKGTIPSPQTTPTKGTPQTLVHTHSTIAVVNTPTSTVSSSPSKTQASSVTVKPVGQNQQSTGGKPVFQKPAVQNSQLLIRSTIPVSKSNLSPLPGAPSPVLLIKTEVNPARPLLTVGQSTTKVLDKNGKEVPQPSQLQLHLQGQISQNQLKVTSQGLKSVQPAGKSKVSKKVETLALIQKTDCNVENKIPSKTCQLASLLRGDIAAAHRNAVKQVSLVTGSNTPSTQVLTSQSTTHNVLVPVTGGSPKDTPTSGVGIKQTIVKNSGDASTSGTQGIKLIQTPVNVPPQAIPISVTPKTMHSVILINEDTKKVPGIQLPSKTISGSLSTQKSEKVMLTSSVKTTAARMSPSTNLTNATVNFTKQVSKTSDLPTGQVSGGKEQVKTVIAKIGMQTLLLQLPVSDSEAVNKSPEVSKVNKPAPKKAEIPSNAALIESLKKQAVEKEEKLKEAARLSYMDRKLGLPIKMADSQEKRIHKWKKKTPEEKLLSFSKKLLQDDPLPVKDIDPLCIENYPDVQSLVRAAIKRHPIVSPSANIHQHPYCAKTLEQWLEWNVGKRRASEWQRAVACQKYLKKLLDGDQFKGNQLWSVKKIVCWCRLHAYSPHYMEKTLHPTGVEFSMKEVRLGERFSSATDNCDMIVEVEQINSKLRTESLSEDEVDIVSNEPPKPKIKEEPQEETFEPQDPVILPASANARFVQDLTQKIGVKFEPSPVLDDVYGSVSEDVVYKAMLCFVEDIITEAFAFKVNMGRYPDGIGVADVYKALSVLPQADFLTNKHLGVKDITR